MASSHSPPVNFARQLGAQIVEPRIPIAAAQTARPNSDLPAVPFSACIIGRKEPIGSSPNLRS